MSTKKLQILGSFGGSDADTLDGKHASEFASASDVEQLKNNVGDSPVSEQINDAVTGAGVLTIDREDEDAGIAPYINADLLGGKPASDYVLNEDVVLSVNGVEPNDSGDVKVRQVFDQSGKEDHISFAVGDSEIGIHESLHGYHAYLYKENGSVVVYNPSGEAINVLYGTAYKPTAADVGARPSDWIPSIANLAYAQRGAWDGNAAPQDIPDGITYAEGGTSQGFPRQFSTCLTVKNGVVRCVQMLITKESGELYVRASVTGTEWGNWAQYLSASRTYPVGSIYLSVNSTSPASLFGGTWEQLKDRFLLGAGSSYTAGNTGGETTHKLTIDEMPYHNHPYLRTAMFYDEVTTDTSCLAEKSTLSTLVTSYTNHTGGDQPHNNMPPYLAVYMWKRVA